MERLTNNVKKKMRRWRKSRAWLNCSVPQILISNGFMLVSQKGSHQKYRHAKGRSAIVPEGRKEIPRGTLASIIRQSELSKELFSYL